MPQIKVHEKALAHLSRGLYRSPASAIKELVSNAWDANATVVHINTNYPNFLQLSVQDNGDGFTKEEFEKLMEGGIGNSTKRELATGLKHGRPIIGRLGIGMLGIAQICGSFGVVSKTASGKGFKAVVRLYDFLKDRVDRRDIDIVKESGNVIEEVDIGQYEFEEFDPASARKGTLIYSDHVQPMFVRTFQESLKNEKFQEPVRDWKGNLKLLGKVHSLQELGDYWRLLWELAASCPIPYCDQYALPKGLIKEDQKRLIRYNFSVYVDGIKLAKPVYLKGNKNGYTTERIEQTDHRVYQRRLSYHGYITAQEGLQLKPDELRGILIRIRNVAIGYYDPSLLDYRFNEGPRSRWITGEILVDEGLENALNIDRDSFNRFHSEFRVIQQRVHDILRNHLFPAIYKNIDARSAEKDIQREDSRGDLLAQIIEPTLGKSVRVLKGKEFIPDGHTMVTVEQTGSAARVKIPDPSTIPVKSGNRSLASAIMTIFEIASQADRKEEKRRLFSELLIKLLSRW
jgi:hypothetical protein